MNAPNAPAHHAASYTKFRTFTSPKLRRSVNLLILTAFFQTLHATNLHITLTNQTAQTIDLNTTGDSGNQHILVSSKALIGKTNAAISTPVQVKPVNAQGLSTFTVPLSEPQTYLAVKDFTPSSLPPILGGTNGIKVIFYPEDTIVTNTGTAYFSIVAESAQTNNLTPLSYQWYKNEVLLPGATLPTLIITNAQFTTNAGPSDVGFYSVDVTVTNQPPIRVRSAECDSPGARLYIYTGTNTAIHGPYQPGTGTASCIGTFSGWVPFYDRDTGSKYFLRPSYNPTFCTITDTTAGLVGYSSKVYYYASTGFSNCGTTTLDFPASAPAYLFKIYVTSSPFPLGADITLDVKWHN